MTAQIHDHLHFRQSDFQIIGVRGFGLWTPHNFDMSPAMMHTGCYRGFHSRYEIMDNDLILTAITIRTSDNKYRPIDGIRPQSEQFGAAHYSDLYLPTPFSGMLLVGKDFINTMYVHMGYQKPASFQTVLELVFAGGVLHATTDYSERYALIREAARQRIEQEDAENPDGFQPDRESMAQWINTMFSLDYHVDL
jgi:hypothetical protein